MLLVSKDDLYECRGFIGDMIGWLPGEGGHTINEDKIINNIRYWLKGNNYVIGKADKHISYLLNLLYRYFYHLPEEKGEIESLKEEIKSLKHEIQLLEVKVEMYERFLQHDEKNPPGFPQIPNVPEPLKFKK